MNLRPCGAHIKLIVAETLVLRASKLFVIRAFELIVLRAMTLFVLPVGSLPVLRTMKNIKVSNGP